MPRPIYYIIADVVYVRKKKTQKKENWIVSTYDNVNEINTKDKKTINRLLRDMYGKNWNTGQARVVKIKSIKKVGQTNV